MSEVIQPLVGSAIVFALYMVLAAYLLRKYKSTGDVGFLWLGAAVVAWPIVANLLGWCGHALTEHFVNAHRNGRHTFRWGLGLSATLSMYFGFLQQVIGIGLLLMAVHSLSKSREQPEPLAQ
jgi:hypothetical protein